MASKRFSGLLPFFHGTHYILDLAIRYNNSLSENLNMSSWEKSNEYIEGFFITLFLGGTGW